MCEKFTNGQSERWLLTKAGGPVNRKAHLSLTFNEQKNLKFRFCKE